MSAETEGVQDALDHAFAAIGQTREAFAPQLKLQEAGALRSVATGVAKVGGLPGAGFEELLEFAGGLYGIAFNLDEDEIGVALLGDHAQLRAGDAVRRTGRVLDVAVGDALLGRVVDPLGRPPSTAARRSAPARACRSSGRPHRSWSARRSRCRCKRA